VKTDDNVSIFQFFEPLVPANIVIEYFRNGRKTGNANVDFNSARDAKDALKKHKAMMGMMFSSSSKMYDFAFYI